MLSKKSIQFLFASILMLSGVGVSASEKTEQQAKHASALLAAIEFTKGISVGLASEDGYARETEQYFDDQYKQCVKYAANKREIQDEREECEIACTQALANCNTALTGSLLFSKSAADRRVMSSTLQKVNHLGKTLLTHRIYEDDGLTFEFSKSR